MQERGVTALPRLYFVGLTWRTAPKSAFIGTVGAEAAHGADHIAAGMGRAPAREQAGPAAGIA